MSLMEDGAFRWHRPNSNILAGRAEILNTCTFTDTCRN